MIVFANRGSYQLKLRVRNTRPAVWRRLFVPQHIRTSLLRRAPTIALGTSDGLDRHESFDPMLSSLVRATSSSGFAHELPSHFRYTVRVERFFAANDNLQPVVCTAGDGVIPSASSTEIRTSTTLDLDRINCDLATLACWSDLSRRAA